MLLGMSTQGSNPADRVIRRFGGQTVLARLLGRRQSTVEHWAATGRIPAQWHEPLMALARERGIPLEARDFMEGGAQPIGPASGRLGVLMVGLGAVASTFVAGVELVRRGHARPIGSLTQMGTIRLGRRTDERVPLIRDFVPLADLDQLTFGAWDPFPDNAYQAALRCGVLDRHTHIAPVASELAELEPMSAAFDREHVRRLDGPNVKAPMGKRELVEAIRADIRDFRESRACDRLVMIWCASTEVYLEETDVHRDMESFERAVDADDPRIAPSMLYACAALLEGVPFINGAPNLTVDIPALVDLACEHRLPVCGKDFKTGQTLVKTVIAPMLKARMLGLRGWYSTNILGNRDGEVLDDPDSFRTKEETKLGVLEGILQPALYPELYGDVYHKVRINYYPPRGDSKEGWANRATPPRSSRTPLAGPIFGAIPPPALVLLGIVSVQVGSALAKHLFSAVGSFGTVALRLFFAAAVLTLLWRPSLRMNRRTWTV